MRWGAALVVVWCATAAWAQVARVDVYTPSAIVIVGDEVRLAVAARNAQEQILLDSPLTFTSSQPSILAVDSRGIVRALRPGQANLVVRSGNQQATVELLAAPKRISVDPPAREIFVGERIQFTATAFDINDKAIPSVAFAWTVTGANGGQINAATIGANTGLLVTNGVSELTVRANINFVSRPDRFPPQFTGVARVSVKPPVDYRISRLLSTDDVREHYQMRRLLANVTGNDRGQLVFRASLDGISSCVVLYDPAAPSAFRCAASAGLPRPLGGNIVTPFGQPAINNRGEVLVAASGIGLLLIDGEGHATYPVQDGAYFGDYVLSGGFSVSKKSLNDYGEIAFAFNFRSTAGNAGTLRSLARLTQGEPEFVWTSDQALAGLTGAVTLEDWGIDRDGVVYFQASAPGGRALYRADRFQAPRRLIGLGDANEGSPITTIGSLQVAENGVLGFVVSRQNGTLAIGRMAAGSAAVETIRSTGNPSGPLAISSNGVILFRGDAGSGYGLYRWDGAQAALVLARGNTPDGESVTAFNAGVIDASGRVIAQAATAAREFVLFPASGGAATLLRTEGSIDVTARVHLPVGSALIPGERPGNLRVRLGDVRSAYEVDRASLVPKLVDLDGLPDGGRFLGDGASFEEPGGDLMFVVNNTIFRQTGAGMEMVLRNQLVSEDNQRLSFSTGIRPAINRQGALAVVAATQTGQRRIYLRPSPGAALQSLAVLNSTRAGAGGDIITGVRALAIDNAGRVMAQLDVRNTPTGLYLWSGNEWTPVALPQATMVTAVPLREIVRAPLASANRFYAVFNLGEPGQAVLPVLAEFASDRWTPLVTSGDALPQGGSVAGFGAFDVNERGEIAVAINGNTLGSSGLLLRTVDGNLRLVHQLNRPAGSTGEYLTGNFEVDLRGDGRIFFGSMTISDAYAIFSAEPMK